MTPEEMQAAIAAVAQNQQTAAQAAAVNAAYMNNQLPVLPQNGNPTQTADYSKMTQAQREVLYHQEGNELQVTYRGGTAEYLTPLEYQQRYGQTVEQNEQQKYNIFNNIGAVNPNTLPDNLRDTYSQQSRQQTSEYYTRNPTEQFQAISNQYNLIKSGTVYSGGQLNWASGGMQLSDPSGDVGFSGNAAIYAKNWNPLQTAGYNPNLKASDYASIQRGQVNPFKPDEAAGIAWDVAVTGGTFGKSLETIANAEMAKQKVVVPDSWVNDSTPDFGNTVPIRDTGFNPTEFETVTAFMPVGGWNELTIRNASLGLDKRTGELAAYQPIYDQYGKERNIKNLIGGGGRYALQSGMFSVNEALVPSDHVFEQWDVGKIMPVSEEYMSTHSRAGAEAYGGFSLPLDGRTLQPNDAISRYGNEHNLANFVDQIAGGKSEAPGANIPWGIPTGSPAMQYMNERGMTGEAIGVPGGGSNGRLIGGGMVGGAGTITDIGVGDLPTPFKSNLPEVRIEKQTGALPFFGEVPYLSPFISEFMPMREISTTSETTLVPTTYETQPPYTIGDTTFTETIATSGIITTKTETSKDLETPFTSMVQGILPEPDKAKARLRIASLTNPFMMSNTIGVMVAESGANFIDKFSPSYSEGIRANTKWAEKIEGLSFVPAYTAARKDPAMVGVSYGMGALLGGSGGALRSFGVGTEYLQEASTGGQLYQSASKVVSMSLGAMYANDVSVRATGISLGEWQRPNVPNLQSKWKGTEHMVDTLNAATTTEIAPFMMGVGGGAWIGDKIAQRVQTRNLPEVKNPNEFSYDTQEGYPTHNEITTKDLRDSFNQGTVKLKANLLEGTMQPNGQPITRVPSNPQRDVPAIFGETHVYSGQPTNRLAGGFVTPGGSEIPGLYVSPVGDTYFTKAGTGQGGGGFGMTSDLLGIYRNPTMYRPTLKQGDMVEIPQGVMSTPTRGMSANDPLNPRNIAIDAWMESNLQFGKMAYGQYGKSEWQGIYRSGSEVTTKNIGWYADVPSGSRIMLTDVVFTGKGVATPRPKTIDPTTGKQVYEIGRNYMGIPSSPSVSSKTSPPIASMVFAKSPVASSVSSSVESPAYSSTTSARKLPASSPESSIKSSVFSTPSSSRFPSYESSLGSSQGSSRVSSAIDSPFSSKPSSSRMIDSISYPRTSFTQSRSSSGSESSITKIPSVVSTSGSISTSGFESVISSGGSHYTTGTDITKIKTPFGGGAFVGGSGSGRYGSPSGVDRWAYQNPTADIGYLSRGMGNDPFSGGGESFGAKCRHTTAKLRAKCSRRKRNG